MTENEVKDECGKLVSHEVAAQSWQVFANHMMCQGEMPNGIWAMHVALESYEANRWQPIETAPKDGTDILLLGQDSKGKFWDFPEVGYWNEKALEDKDNGERVINPGFCESGVAPIRFWNVTHWMLVPRPTTQSTNELATKEGK